MVHVWWTSSKRADREAAAVEEVTAWRWWHNQLHKWENGPHTKSEIDWKKKTKKHSRRFLTFSFGPHERNSQLRSVTISGVTREDTAESKGWNFYPPQSQHRAVWVQIVSPYTASSTQFLLQASGHYIKDVCCRWEKSLCRSLFLFHCRLEFFISLWIARTMIFCCTCVKQEPVLSFPVIRFLVVLLAAVPVMRFTWLV